MASIHEKIQFFLQKQTAPAGVAAMLADAAFASCNRQELNEILLSMCRAGTIHRCVREGKALYSLQPLEDEVTNPAASFISNFQTGINGFLSSMQAGTDEETQAAGLLGLARSLGNLSALADSVAEQQFTEFPKLTYQERNHYQSSLYSISIPDGFRTRANWDDRDFVAWLPNEEAPDDPDSGRIILYSGKDQNQDLGVSIDLPETMAALILGAVWEGKSQMDNLMTTEMFSIPCDPVGGCMLMENHNAHIQLGFPNGIKHFRVFLSEPLAPGMMPTFANFVREWISTLKLTKPFAGVTPLDDASYLEQPLTSDLVKRFEQGAEQWKQQLAAIQFNLMAKAALAELQYRSSHGNVSDKLTHRMFSDCLTDHKGKWEAVARQACHAIEHFAQKDPRNPLLLNLHTTAKEIFGLDRWTVTLDEGNEITVVSDAIPEYIKRANAAVSALTAEQEAQKQNEKQERLQQYQQKCAQGFAKELYNKQLQNTRSSVEAEAEAANHSALKTAISNSTRALEQNQFQLQNELSSTGFFAFSKKKELKQRIAQCSTDLSFFRMLKRTVEGFPPHHVFTKAIIRLCQQPNQSLTIRDMLDETNRSEDKLLLSFVNKNLNSVLFRSDSGNVAVFKLFVYPESFALATLPDEKVIESRTLQAVFEAEKLETAGEYTLDALADAILKKIQADEWKDYVPFFDNDECKEIIMSVANRSGMTVSEFMAADPRLQSAGNVRLAAILRMLKDEGKLERFELNRKGYFRLV